MVNPRGNNIKNNNIIIKNRLKHCNFRRRPISTSKCIKIHFDTLKNSQSYYYTVYQESWRSISIIIWLMCVVPTMLPFKFDFPWKLYHISTLPIVTLYESLHPHVIYKNNQNIIFWIRNRPWLIALCSAPIHTFLSHINN